ncbi:MAG: hypothetical protein ACOYD4_11775 [Solirubrobacterales bacterium]
MSDWVTLEKAQAALAAKDARIAELEAEAAAFDTALWSGRLQEVEQYNANANARIAELEALVDDLFPTDFANAPDWANWVARHAVSKSHWYESEPVEMEDGDYAWPGKGRVAVRYSAEITDIIARKETVSHV